MPMQAALRRFKAEIFHALSHPTRIAIIDHLREGEISGKDLIERLDVEATNANQHLSVLRSKKIIVGRREGHQVFYTVRDPQVFELLDVGRRYFQSHMSEALEVLQEMTASDITVKPGRAAELATGTTFAPVK